MVIANGFITEDEEFAFQEARKMIKGKELKKAVMPPFCTMSYFISDIGEMFGCQQMKSFCLTKPLRIEQRYSPGCNIRYSVGGGKQKTAYMQYIMYATFVSGCWDEKLKLAPKDGNPNNYQLDNIEVKEENLSVFCTNVCLLQEVYHKEFKNVAWYAKWVSDRIELEDAKDIAANTFYELCRIPFPYDPNNFVGLWKDQSKKRAFDFLAFHHRFEGLTFDDGEERFGKTDRQVEVADIWRHIRGEKRTKTMQLFSQGETPTEIAEALGTTLGTVSSCITRTVQHLQGIYKNDIAV